MDEDTRIEAIKKITDFMDNFTEEFYEVYKLKVEMRELRQGDFSLGESIVFDDIKEFQEKKLTDDTHG